MRFARPGGRPYYSGMDSVLQLPAIEEEGYRGVVCQHQHAVYLGPVESHREQRLLSQRCYSTTRDIALKHVSPSGNGRTWRQGKEEAGASRIYWACPKTSSPYRIMIISIASLNADSLKAVLRSTEEDHQVASKVYWGYTGL